MQATLRDIAERAGVSVPTASRVLSGSSYPVSDDLRHRVEEAAASLDYVPNAQARTLLTGREQSIGVLVGSVDDPYFSEIVNGIHEAADGERLLIMVSNTSRDPARELEHFRLFHAHRSRVIIIAGSGIADPSYTATMTARAASFMTSGGRVVSIGSTFDGVDRVVVDNREAGRSLARHLVDLGHRRIGVIGGDPRVTSTLERIAGVREVVEGVDGSLSVRHVTADRNGGLEGAEALLAEDPQLTALVGTADQMAIGALAHLRAVGTDCPGRVSVAGFNDIPLAQDLVPPLTSVHLPLREMGKRALQMGLADRPGTGQQVVELDTELRIRASTAGPPQ